MFEQVREENNKCVFSAKIVTEGSEILGDERQFADTASLERLRLRHQILDG